MCKCRETQLGFTDWVRIQELANSGDEGFDKAPRKPGIYCLRASHVGERGPERIVARYLESDFYAAFENMARKSGPFFDKCGFGPHWGWQYYKDWPVNELSKIARLIFDAGGALACPILYLGCTKSLRNRLQQLLYWAHPFNHCLWALLYSGWQIELATREEADHGGAEGDMKKAYKEAHEGRLAPFMAK